jgi:hypothetical protein
MLDAEDVGGPGQALQVNLKILWICDLQTATPRKFADLLKRVEPKNLRLCDLRTLKISLLAHLCSFVTKLIWLKIVNSLSASKWTEILPPGNLMDLTKRYRMKRDISEGSFVEVLIRFCKY